jgi:hypothetical protein
MGQAEAVADVVHASVNYWDPALPRGRFDTINPDLNRMAFEAHDIEIRDMHAAKETFSLGKQGFTLTTHESKVARLPEMAETNLTAQSGLPAINRAYYDEVVPLIQEISGAREVIPQSTGLTVRFSTRSKRQSWAGTAGFVHLDVTDKSAQRFLDFSLAAAEKPIRPWRRFVLYQTWRMVVDPPQDNSLALCDRRSVPQSDVVFYDAIIGGEGTALESIEARSCKYSPAHRWWYAPDMGAKDILVFVGYDSAAPGGVQPFHTGFDIPGNETCTPRASLEARFFAFYD